MQILEENHLLQPTKYMDLLYMYMTIQTLLRHVSTYICHFQEYMRQALKLLQLIKWYY